MAAQVSQQIAKDAILWVNSFNYLLTETCRSLDADSLKLRLYYLEASRIIVVEIAAFKNSVCSLKFLVLKIYQKLWLRTRVSPHPNRRLKQTQPQPLSYALLVDFSELESRPKTRGDEKQALTRYVSDVLANFPFNPYQTRQSDTATTLAAKLDAAFPFSMPTSEGRDRLVCTLSPWSTPLPARLDVTKYLLKDMPQIEMHLKWVSVQYDVHTHSVRPILANSYIALLQQQTRLADIQHILQAFLQVHGFLSVWVWKMIKTKTAVPFYDDLEKRRRDPMEKWVDLVATQHPLWPSSDCVHRVRALELREIGH